MTFDDVDELKSKLRQIASECVSKGPGYAQEGVVLREARKILGPRELEHEQMILEARHSLFTDGEEEASRSIRAFRERSRRQSQRLAIEAGGWS